MFAASIKAQLRETIGSTFVGDYVINTTNGGALSFSQSFIDRLNTLPEVGTATGLGFVPIAGADGERAGGATINPETAAGLLQFEFVHGSMSRPHATRHVDQRGRSEAQASIARRSLRCAHRRTSSAADRAGHLRHGRLHPGAHVSPRHVRWHELVEHRRLRVVDTSEWRRRWCISIGSRRQHRGLRHR